MPTSLRPRRRFCSAYGLGDEDLCFNLMPLYHVHGLISGGMSSLLAGSAQLCAGPLAPAAFAQAYENLRPTWFTGSPPVHLALRDYYETAGRQPHNDRLRFFRSSSAPFPAPAIAALEALFGAPLYENYGMTETAATVCSNLPPPARRKVGGVGSSIGAEIRIADEHGVDVARGVEGEILLKGRERHHRVPGAPTMSTRRTSTAHGCGPVTSVTSTRTATCSSSAVPRSSSRGAVSRYILRRSTTLCPRTATSPLRLPLTSITRPWAKIWWPLSYPEPAPN